MTGWKGWRDFLSPDTKRIAIFLVIVIGLVPFLVYDNGIRCIREPCPTSELGSVLTYLFRSHNLYLFDVDYPYLAAGIVFAVPGEKDLNLLSKAC